MLRIVHAGAKSSPPPARTTSADLSNAKQLTHEAANSGRLENGWRSEFPVVRPNS
jgi:hypothetical protein